MATVYGAFSRLVEEKSVQTGKAEEKNNGVKRQSC